MNSADIFQRVAHYLRDYRDTLDSALLPDDQLWQTQREEVEQLLEQLDALQGEYERRVKFSDAKNCAAILTEMLRDWKLPGAVWYAPWRARFRLTGGNYKPESKHEICVGVYAPDAPCQLLEEDLRFVMEGK